jgi:hypothetical protein
MPFEGRRTFLLFELTVTTAVVTCVRCLLRLEVVILLPECEIVIFIQPAISAVMKTGASFIKGIKMPISKQPVRLYVFYHDDVPQATERIVPRTYLMDCINELQKITGREFLIDYKSKVPGLTDIDYKALGQASLDEWIKRIRDYTQTHQLPRSKTERYLLVTQDNLDKRTMGITYSGHYALIASVFAYQTIAHELGHSFGATHEDAELQHNAFGGVCETYTYPERNPGRGNCYSYSLKNRERIRAFLSDAP